MNKEQKENLKVLLSKGWQQKYVAKDRDGNICGSNDVTAVAWCLAGACWKLNIPNIRPLTDLAIKKGFPSVMAFNDAPERTLGEVLSFIDEIQEDSIE